MSVLSVYVTFHDLNEAEKIVRMMLEKRLAACANIMIGHESIYWWQGEIHTAPELAVMFKTTEELYDKFEAELKALHPYDCPCIVAWPVEKGYMPYLEWVKQSVAH
jgi:periplasmic divalent cation tolerance protein